MNKNKCKEQFSIKVHSNYQLGEAWAGNTINTAIFRYHGLLTDGEFQYSAFYVDEHTLRLVCIALASGEIETYDMLGQYNLCDAHNSISLGIDRAGCLHLCYDHHATQLRYRRATQAHSIAAWTDELPMTGVHEVQVTYPAFILPRHDFPLTLLYRDGKAGKGTVRIKTYLENKKTWQDHPKAILSGAEQKPWTSSAYCNHPVVGTDNCLHLSFVWRTHSIGKNQQVNNINIGYAYSPDNGLTWLTSRHRPYRLPITQVNAETVWPVSPASNLINQTGMALDHYNRPHIVFYADDEQGIVQYQHLWFNGSGWRQQLISQRQAAFSLAGRGTLQLPISRPDIVIDQQNNAYVIYQGDITNNRMAVTCLPAQKNYDYHPKNTYILYKENLGHAEPVIDHSRWERDHRLSILLQHNEQPNNDGAYISKTSPITLLDVSFEFIQ